MSVIGQEEVTTLPTEMGRRIVPDAVLMVRPDFFDVKYEINTHMKGNIGTVDVPRAQEQWNVVLDAIENTGSVVNVIEPDSELPDHVFTANTAVMNKRDGVVTSIQSRMLSPFRSREAEVFAARWARPHDYTVVELPPNEGWYLEGMGDMIWHPGREFLYSGFGHRTSRSVLNFVADTFDVPVLALELVDDRWYHLDVAFSPLNESTVAVVPQAFTSDGLVSIRRYFDTVIELNEADAMNFVGNGFTPDFQHFIVQQGISKSARSQIEAAGLAVIEVDTSEFMKAGGSVYCMKLEAYR